MLRSLAKTLFHQLPRSEILYRIAKRYVDDYHGDHNCDPATNGEFRFLRQELPKAKVVFDVGANVGDWTRAALEANPAAQIHCFEPSRATFEKLLQNRFPPNIVCNNFGVGASPGQATLHLFGPGCGENSLFIRPGMAQLTGQVQTAEEQVRLESLDGYCQERGIARVDFIKVDVEGYELEVFKGMTRLLQTGCVNTIQFEYGGTYLAARILLQDIFDLVRATNPAYSFLKILPRRLLPVPAYSPIHETFQYSNWVVCRQQEGG